MSDALQTLISSNGEHCLSAFTLSSTALNPLPVFTRSSQQAREVSVNPCNS